MSGKRFRINSRSIRNGFAAFDGDLFNHIVRVLRLGTGAPLTLVDEKGSEYQGVINQVDRDWVVIKIVEIQDTPPPDALGPRLTICQALPKGDKIDLILQKGTELGAHDFWLFGGRRSVARVRKEQCDAKLERWNRITTEAARQSCRPTVPDVRWFSTADEAAAGSHHDLRLLLWEGERKQNLKSVITSHVKPDSAIVAIGPEGGFDPLEVESFTGRDFQSVSLGSNILRTETAAIAITAILQYLWDEY